MTEREYARQIAGMLNCLEVVAMPIYAGPDLSTPMARVDYASHLWGNYGERMGYSYVYQLCSAKGISEQEIEDGVALGKARQSAYRSLRSRYGDPAYGSWPESAPTLDAHILDRAADEGVSYCKPAPGVREEYQRAADVLRKYSEVSA